MLGSFCGDHHRRWGAGQPLIVLFNFAGPLLMASRRISWSALCRSGNNCPPDAALGGRASAQACFAAINPIHLLLPCPTTVARGAYSATSASPANTDHVRSPWFT